MFSKIKMNKKISKTLVIAEAGVNHNGKISLAKKMIKAASKAGADIIKFQTFKADSLLRKNTKKPNYIKINKKKVTISNFETT